MGRAREGQGGPGRAREGDGEGQAELASGGAGTVKGSADAIPLKSGVSAGEGASGSSSKDAWSGGVWVGSGGGVGPVGVSGLSIGGLVDLLAALAQAHHFDPLLLDVVAQRLAQEC
ncbi:hypothetical protein DUNSADRAFT_17051 [Dunaliella salina]|uniref:Encoded protein n=1 Tax=Dunaliella salina TaxID=3046 RepID=A0ABQ7H0H4_DUNSA|nr:hypothetical protein DUNSADRAFT_17051 [Dunaliella salina]|eukprot:KAF5840354.1 hypothetical protein DUNSADRAFT_17051 [Dunaliella salina]